MRIEYVDSRKLISMYELNWHQSFLFFIPLLHYLHSAVLGAVISECSNKWNADVLFTAYLTNWGIVIHIYVGQWIGSSLSPVMVWHLLGAKPLPEPMMTYSQWDPSETSIKLESKDEFFLRKNAFESILYKISPTLFWYQCGASSVCLPNCLFGAMK